jgi:hypothetical protein
VARAVESTPGPSPTPALLLIGFLVLTRRLPVRNPPDLADAAPAAADRAGADLIMVGTAGGS